MPEQRPARRPGHEELLNTFNLPGLPAHKLDLKPDMPIMLLRNLDPRAGLCSNGTRLLVKRVINGRLLEAVIATGEHSGDVVYIPRVKLGPEEGAFPWEWTRLQFPVRHTPLLRPAVDPTACAALASCAAPRRARPPTPHRSSHGQVRVGFALTINKAQGQTLKCVGVYLETPCFGHGQLYVAASRVGDPAHLCFAVNPDENGKFFTKNVVYREALT